MIIYLLLLTTVKLSAIAMVLYRLYHYEVVDVYELLKVWCLNGSFEFNDVSTRETTSNLMDIFAMIVDDVCEKQCTNIDEIEYAVHMTWYAFKIWTMLESGKICHTTKEIEKILNDNNVNYNQYLKIECFGRFYDVFSAKVEYFYQPSRGHEDIVKCIQHCEALLDIYINKYKKTTERVDISDIPFDLPDLKETDTNEYSD